jgi:dTDP-4-amino-4,6-dideoxygalactose transaminase
MAENRIYLSPPHLGGAELEYVEQAFRSNWIAPFGPELEAFQEEFSDRVGLSHVVALSSGTATMHLALRLLGVSAKEEVLGSTLTFVGSLSPTTFLGASPVLIDSSRDTWNLDPDLLEEEVRSCARRGKLPKAVVPTDLYGQCADLDRILEVCQPYGVPVIADSAEAMGATYKGKHAGVGARAAVFSFNGNKIITTSSGGMLASNDKAFIDRARHLANQARDPAPHYEHSEIGYNYRMSNILAAVGRAQLKILDKRVEQKRAVFAKYQDLLGDLPGIEFMPEAPYGRSNRWLTVILVTPEEFGVTNEDIRLALEAENIESRPVWKPMHLQPVFRDCRVRGGAVAEDLFARGLCLPSGTALEDSDLERICGIIRKQHK